MNRYQIFSIAISMTLSTLVTLLRAANKPRAGTDSQNPVVWTNDNLERLHGRSGSHFHRGPHGRRQPAPTSAPAPYMKTQDPAWYAEQGTEPAR